MDDPFAKLQLDPATRAVTDAAIDRLVQAGLVEGAADARELQANALKEMILSSTALPWRIRWRVSLSRPVRNRRVRRALRPLRASFRALALPDAQAPWIEEHEAFRILLHGL